MSVQLSDSEPAVDERRDRFVAQLYKFMDDRGTPINRAPTFAGSDLDLFHLFRLMASMGGYNRVSFIIILFSLLCHIRQHRNTNSAPDQRRFARTRRIYTQCCCRLSSYLSV